MAASLPWVADSFFALAAVLFLSKVFTVPEVRRRPRIIATVATLAIVFATIAVNHYINWPRIVVSPRTVVFRQRGDRYFFTVDNNTGSDAYKIALLLKTEGSRSNTEFSVDIPKETIRVLRIDDRHGLQSADVTALVCLTSDDSVVVQVFLYRLEPHERRQFTLTYSGRSSARVNTSGVRYQIEPVQIKTDSETGTLCWPYRPLASAKTCQQFRWAKVE